MRIRVESDGGGEMILDDGEPMPLEDVNFRDGVLTTVALGSIPTSDALLHPAQTIALKLVLRRVGTEPDGNQILEGQATAQTTGYPSHFALSSYLKLARRD